MTTCRAGLGGVAAGFPPPRARGYIGRVDRPPTSTVRRAPRGSATGGEAALGAGAGGLRAGGAGRVLPRDNPNIAGGPFHAAFPSHFTSNHLPGSPRTC